MCRRCNRRARSARARPRGPLRRRSAELRAGAQTISPATPRAVMRGQRSAAPASVVAAGVPAANVTLHLRVHADTARDFRHDEAATLRHRGTALGTTCLRFACELYLAPALSRGRLRAHLSSDVWLQAKPTCESWQEQTTIVPSDPRPEKNRRGRRGLLSSHEPPPRRSPRPRTDWQPLTATSCGPAARSGRAGETRERFPGGRSRD